MSEDALKIGQPQGFAEFDARSVSPQSTAPVRFGFSLLVSLVSAAVMIAALGMILRSSTTLPLLERVTEPNRALDLMVSRTMEAQDGLRQSPEWQQWLVEWTIGSNETEQIQAIQWYQELVRTTGDPLAKLRLAILQGESGHETEALDEMNRWQDLGSTMPLFGQLIEAAYGAQSLDKTREIELQAALAETLPDGWFYNHLAARLAQRASNQALLTTVERQIAVRGEQVQGWLRVLIMFELAYLFIGSVMLVGIARFRGQRTDILRLHLPGVPPPWRGGIGTMVLLSGGAIGAVITVAFLSFPPVENISLRALAIPLANLPLLALAYVHLFKPVGLSFWSGFGLHIKRAYFGRLFVVVLAVVAAGLWGEWVLGRVAELLRLTSHWTEWFDPNLVWAPGSVLAISLLETVVFAPIFEELTFRGLFYATLRRRFSFLPAAWISAGIFALAHGYGMIGFISVLWSGFLWAWIYEKTGSLIPGMIAHALNNLLVCLAVMMLLRA